MCKDKEQHFTNTDNTGLTTHNINLQFFIDPIFWPSVTIFATEMHK